MSASLALEERRADFDLDLFGSALADEQVVLLLDKLDDGVVHAVATHPCRIAVDDPSERDDCDFGGAATDVHDHAAAGFGHRQSRPNRCGHRLLDQEDFPRSSRFSGFLDGAAFDLGDSGGHGDDDTRLETEKREAALALADEVAQHLLCDVEIGDHSILHGANRRDRSRSAA